MQITPTKSSATNGPFNPRPENGPGGLPIGVGWRPADTSKIDLAMVRMSISASAQPKKYNPEDAVGPANELKIPSIEDDVGAHLRHWFLLFRIPNPDLGPESPEDLDAAEAKAFSDAVEESDPTRYDEELPRRAPLKSKQTVWMQVDVTGSDKAIYRTAWKNLPTTSGPTVDYAGTCNLTVADVREQMNGLLAQFPDYVNKKPKVGEGTPPGVYYCHTFVRLLNERLGLNITIPTVTAYK